MDETLGPSEEESKFKSQEPEAGDQERESTELAHRSVFALMEIAHGAPREGEERESWGKDQEIAKRVIDTCESKEFEIPTRLLQQYYQFISTVSLAGEYHPTLQPELIDIIEDTVAGKLGLDLARHETHPYIEKNLRVAFPDQEGKAFEEAVLGIFDPSDLENPNTVIDLFKKFRDFYQIFCDIRESSWETAPGVGGEILTSEPVIEVLDNYTLEELAQSPIRPVDILGIIAEFEEAFPKTWSECSPLEQNIVRKIMREAVSSKPGAILIDSPEGPIITAQKDEN